MFKTQTKSQKFVSLLQDQIKINRSVAFPLSNTTADEYF